MAFPRVNGLRSFEFGTPGEFRDELNALVLSGKKQATSGLLEWDYLKQDEVIENVGEKLAVLNNEGSHIATVEVTKVEVVHFSEVPDEFALAEGEGDLSGDDYRKGHFSYWTRMGYEINPDTEVVLVYFKLIEKV